MNSRDMDQEILLLNTFLYLNQKMDMVKLVDKWLKLMMLQQSVDLYQLQKAIILIQISLNGIGIMLEKISSIGNLKSIRVSFRLGKMEV